MNSSGLDYFNDKVDFPHHLHDDGASKNLALSLSMLSELGEGYVNGFKSVGHLAFAFHPRYWLATMLLSVLVLLNFLPAHAQEADDAVHLTKFKSYQDKANLLYGQGMRLEAIDMLDSALALTEKIWPNSEKEAEIYSVTGSFYANMGEYARSEKAYDHALQLFMDAVKDKYVETVQTLNRIILLQRTMGQYNKVVDNQTTLLRLCKIYDPKNDQKILQCHMDIADAYIELGRYETADSFFTEANYLSINHAISNDEQYAVMLYKWAGLQQRLGQLEKAENSYLNALKYLNSSSKNQKDLIVTTKVDLADMYLKYGRINDAQAYYIKAKKYIDKEGNWFKRRLPYSPVMLGIAKIYRQTGQFDNAVELYEVAMDIMENKLQQRYPEYARLEYELATLYHDFGYPQEAEEHYRNAIRIWEGIVGSHLPYYPLAMAKLGQLFRDIQLWEHAELQLVSARNHWENNMGYHSSHYIDNLIQLADVYIQTAAFDRARQVYVDASEQARQRLVHMVQFMSEQEMNQYMIKYVQAQDKMFSLFTHFPNDSLLAATCFDNILFYKGFLLQAAVNMKQNARRHPEGRELLDQLNATRRMISLEYSKPVTNIALLDTLTSKANQQERMIANHVAGYESAVQMISWQDVQAQLKQHEAAVEFFWNRSNDTIQYAALILTAQSVQPIFVPLFTESELFPLLKEDVSDRANYIQQLYAPEERKMIQLSARPKSLFALIWKPIERMELKAIRTFYYAPAGVIHWVNVPAIAIDETKILADKYQMIALSSTRRLVPRNEDILIKESDAAIVVGGVNFDYTGNPNQNPKSTLSSLSQDAAINAVIQSNLSIFGTTWAFLFWTALEADSIRNILQSSGWNVTQLNGEEATEQRIKRAGQLNTSPYLVHIATHGFFFPDSERNITSTMSGEPVFKWSDNPMIRSGLILAGGNYAWQNGHAPHPDMEDGILTAYEISQMNLSNTELVVLSACETGLGDIQGNEGVYGLQRAFKIAGAKYLIMSLWQVPDRETMEFMTTFYTNWLEGKMTIPDAFRKTQRDMRDRFYNPYSWAGFVLVE